MRPVLQLFVVGLLVPLTSCDKSPLIEKSASPEPLSIAPVWVRGREVRYKLTRTVKNHDKKSGKLLELFLYGDVTISVEDVLPNGNCLQRWIVGDFSSQMLLNGEGIPEATIQRSPYLDGISRLYTVLYRRHEFRLLLDRDGSLVKIEEPDRLFDEIMRRYDRILTYVVQGSSPELQRAELRRLLEKLLTKNPGLLLRVACPEAQSFFAASGKGYVLDQEISRRSDTLLDLGNDIPSTEVSLATCLKLTSLTPQTQTAVIEVESTADVESIRRRNDTGFFGLMHSWLTEEKEPAAPEVPECKIHAKYTVDLRSGWPKTLEEHRELTTSSRQKEESYLAERESH